MRRFLGLRRFDATRHRIQPDVEYSLDEFDPGEHLKLMDLGVLEEIVEEPPRAVVDLSAEDDEPELESEPADVDKPQP